MKLIIISKDSVASLVSVVDIESDEEEWLLQVQEPWLSPKAGISPVFWSKEELDGHA